MVKKPLLSVKNLRVSFSHKKEMLTAVKGVSFTLFEGESLGIVGESGSGKTSILHAMTGLSSAQIQGEVFFEETDLLQKHANVLGKKIGMVFQDPLSSLNPTMKIGHQICEGMIYHKIVNRSDAKQTA